MVDFIKISKQYSNLGYSVIPVSPRTKTPSIGSWHRFIEKPMTMQECETFFKNAKGIAMLCGGLNNVFTLDIDSKYFLSHDIWDNFKHKLGKKLLELSVCQETKNKGYHLVYSVPDNCMKGNEKWASRYATAYEKHITYTEAYENPETRDKALKIASNDNSRVMFETRGKGGYFLLSPTEGYKMLHGTKINKIDENQYKFLEETVRSFNEVNTENKIFKEQKYYDNWELSPFDHFNEEGDALEILLDNGWTIKDERKNSVRLLRPGSTYSNSSALFDTSTRLFNVFSTSTIFDVNKTYTPVQIFAILECDEDYSEVYKKLIEKNYGVKT